MIRAEAKQEIGRPPEAVYAVIDDFSRASTWLADCVSLAQVDPGGRRVGARLHYRFKQGGRVGEMDGIVTGCNPPRQLALGFSSAAFEVAVSFDVERADAGATVTHAIAITPKNLIGKLMAPLIRAGNQKQVRANVARLAALCERGADAAATG